MKTFAELQSRLQAVQGVRFEELARAHGMGWPEDIRRAKGTAGRIVEVVLGMERPDNAPAPDLSDLGLEIKSVPLRSGLRPLEATKVTSLNYVKVCNESWKSSTVASKLRAILFAPVVKPSNDEPGDWYIRTPFVWMPSEKALAVLQSDYSCVRHLVQASPNLLSSAMPPRGQGQALTARTSGRNAQDTTTYSYDGRSFTTQRRAFFLRKAFVERILEENVLYRGNQE